MAKTWLIWALIWGKKMNNPEHIQLNTLQKVQLELKAPKSKKNTFGNYMYRNCEDILEAVKPLLQKHNATLIVTDDVQEVGSVVIVSAKAVFTDANGKETIVTAHAGVDIHKKGMDVAQTFGASSSYARKYALNGLFLIDDTKDYDSDEYQHQINNSNKSSNSKQTNPQPLTNSNKNQVQTQQKTATKPKRSMNEAYNDALKAIPNAPDTTILNVAMKHFKGTTFEAGILKACQAKCDLEGWVPA
ncbi:hypothetical protein F960_02876 [Acinetobacter gerneri DSM 14967 = CIP 107464 = MTCC 9824]|uniref:Essential recombination function protein n=2 Tax=Acinetobacter gerneri TaxID=202952 RepID=N8ZHD5_9GAMM|nr:hypothetical protein F960_02876 [Acinetobacter gerneri DSM 14967 = CIP 107464 = MTCC 9824]